MVCTVWMHDDELPAASVAVHVRVIVTVPPHPGTTSSSYVIVGVEQLSVAVAVPVAAGLVSAGHSRTTSGGQVMSGGVSSTTVIVA